jgi:3,5-epimerase/4-reductase
MIVLLYGKNGWISSLMEDVLSSNNIKYYISDVRANNYYDVCSEIEFYRPTHLMSFIGRTHGEGITTIDYLEDKTKLNINVRDNLYAPMVLAEAAKKYDIHLSYLGTGCIYTYNEIHKFGNENTGFTEDDIPNFTGSAYSTVKGYTDQLMQFNPNVLTLRIRMPISSVSNSRNFINKITKYEKICSIPNSMTVLDDFLPIILDMAKNNITGIYNFTNPGLITHNEILQMYKDIVDPDFTWKNFTLEEQAEILKADRSNNCLDTNKIQNLYPNLKNIKDSVRDVLHKMNGDDKNNCSLY